MSYTTTHEHLFAELDRIERIIETHTVDGHPSIDSSDAVDEQG